MKTDSIFNEGFQDELINSSDRACVILGAAGLDETLYRLLKAFLIDENNIVEEFINSKKVTAPLGTFSARIKAAFCLGLISIDNYKDLNYVRKIRNEFAHNLEGLSFDTDQIKSWVGNLIFIKELKEKKGGEHLNTKTQFVISIYQLGGQIKANSESVVRLNKRENSILAG